MVWVRSTFDEGIAPGAKDYDLNIQQYSISADRKKKVDFSSAYYSTPQAIITIKGSKAEKVDTVVTVPTTAITPDNAKSLMGK